MSVTDQDMRFVLDRLHDRPLEGRDRARAYEAFTSVAEDWVPAALNRFDQLRNLHQPVRQHGCVPLCRDCLHQWPCGTRRIIDGEGADQ